MKTEVKRMTAAAVTAAALLAGLAPLPVFADAPVTEVNLNAAPVAKNIAVETYRGVAVTDSFSSMDPEGDEVSYSVTKNPKKGEVTVDGSSFTYTPSDGRKGKDRFTYVAVDSFGNISNEATVTVEVKKQSTAVTYSDMEGSDAWYAATELAERGIFTGEKLGSSYLFSPDSRVTRGEFLAMCVNLAGGQVTGSVTRTGFYDDGDIPDWQKPYVSTAVLLEMITGREDADGNMVFAPGDAVTFAEATVMLNNALSLTDVDYAGTDGCPAWATQAAANLSSCSIIDASGSYASELTRADAAKMLLGALRVMDSRSRDSSILSWLFDTGS